MARTTKSLEESFESLEEIVGKLESEEISLEESFRLYQEGMKLLQKCNTAIDRVEKELVVLTEE